MDEKIDSKYDWQMNMQLLVCGKEWCDYVVYNPNFDKNLFVKRVLPNKKKQDKLREGFKMAEKLITEIKIEIEGE